MSLSPYYQDPSVTIYHADCLDYLELIAADALITDPPYGVNFSGKATKFHGPTGGGYTVPDSDVGVGVVSALLPKVKRALVFPGKSLLHQYPQPNDIGCVFCPAGAGRGAWGFTCMHPVLFYGSRPNRLGMLPSSLQSSQLAESNGHPCPKPIEWMLWAVELASLPDELVVDPFLGSGTTLRAAKDLGRKAIGYEIEERYCEISAKRMAQEVFDFSGRRRINGVAPQLDLF